LTRLLNRLKQRSVSRREVWKQVGSPYFLISLPNAASVVHQEQIRADARAPGNPLEILSLAEAVPASSFLPIEHHAEGARHRLRLTKQGIVRGNRIGANVEERESVCTPVRLAFGRPPEDRE
jgi:hypothetical protein